MKKKRLCNDLEKKRKKYDKYGKGMMVLVNIDTMI
jgi:hypothetical protein